MSGSGSGTTVIGGEIPALEQLHHNFQRQANAVDDLMAALNRDVDSTWWKGGAADRFRTAWETEYQPALRRLSQALVDAGDEVRHRAQLLVQVGS